MSAHDQFTMRMGGGLTWLNTRHELDCTEILVLDTLILLDGPKGCYPTLEKIAKVCGRPQPTVRQVIKKLVKERRLIDYEKRPYRDSRGRERMSKNYYYIFSEEIEHALEFAAETLALDPEEMQLSLLQDDPDSARDDRYRDQSDRTSRTPPPIPIARVVHGIGIPIARVTIGIGINQTAFRTPPPIPIARVVHGIGIPIARVTIGIGTR